MYILYGVLAEIREILVVETVGGGMVSASQSLLALEPKIRAWLCQPVTGRPPPLTLTASLFGQHTPNFALRGSFFIRFPFVFAQNTPNFALRGSFFY